MNNEIEIGDEITLDSETMKSVGTLLGYAIVSRVDTSQTLNNIIAYLSSSKPDVKKRLSIKDLKHGNFTLELRNSRIFL